MENATVTTTTTSVTDLLLGTSTNFTAIAIVVVSGACLVWSSRLYRNCGSKEDRDNEQSIKERVDGYSYRKTIVPLFEIINQSIAEQIRPRILALDIEITREQLVTEYERLKSEAFGTTDFSSIKDTIIEIPLVMFAIENTVKFKRRSALYYSLSSWLLGISIFLLVIALPSVFLYSNNFHIKHSTIINSLVFMWLGLFIIWSILCFWFHVIERNRNILARI